MKQKVTLMLLATFLCCVLGVQHRQVAKLQVKLLMPWENFPELASL